MPDQTNKYVRGGNTQRIRARCRSGCRGHCCRGLRDDRGDIDSFECVGCVHDAVCWSRSSSSNRSADCRRLRCDLAPRWSNRSQVAEHGWSPTYDDRSARAFRLSDAARCCQSRCSRSSVYPMPNAIAFRPTSPRAPDHRILVGSRRAIELIDVDLERVDRALWRPRSNRVGLGGNATPPRRAEHPWSGAAGDVVVGVRAFLTPRPVGLGAASTSGARHHKPQCLYGIGSSSL
jgi:hypothetical protein